MTRKVDLAFLAILLVVFGAAVITALDFTPRTRLLPIGVGLTAIPLILLQLVLTARSKPVPVNGGAQPVDETDAPPAPSALPGGSAPGEFTLDGLKAIGWMFVLMVGAALFGLWVALPAFMLVYLLWVARMRVLPTLALTAAVGLVVFGGLHELLGSPIPPGVVWGWTPFQ